MSEQKYSAKDKNLMNQCKDLRETLNTIQLKITPIAKDNEHYKSEAEELRQEN